MSLRMVKHHRPQWHLCLTAVLILGAMVGVVLFSWPSNNDSVPLDSIQAVLDPYRTSVNLHDRVDSGLVELGIWPDLITKIRHDSAGVEICKIDVRIPIDLPIATVNLALTKLVNAQGGRVFHAIEKTPKIVRMECGFDSLQTTVIELHRDNHLRRKVGLISIVLDDFGHASWTKGLVNRFCAISQTLTLAILPNEGSAIDISELANRHGHEVILHLPMEPIDPSMDPGHSAILVSQDAETIRQQVRNALLRIPNVVGVNNHMGSRATADFRVMSEVLGELQEQKLFFLDSRTSEKSLVATLGPEMKVPIAQRDLFIDAVDVSVEKIKDRLWELAEIASDQGKAIGIGHDREETLTALESTLPRLESRGFRFVSVSQLAK